VPLAVRVMRKKSSVCCCCSGGGGPSPTFAWLAQRMDRKGLQFFHQVIWDKKAPGLGWRYRRRHELVMVAHLKRGKLAWANDDVAVAKILSHFPPKNRRHPNEKPLELVSDMVQLHTTPGQVVLDPFMGSGTTGEVCVRTGRRFIGIDLDPEHFQTAYNRIHRAYENPSNVHQPLTRPLLRADQRIATPLPGHRSVLTRRRGQDAALYSSQHTQNSHT
jgi:DNA modification methylase